MTQILHITASIRSNEESVSRSLSQTLVDGLAGRDGTSVVTRDLAKNDIPFVSAERFAAGLTPVGERSQDQHQLAAFADTLIEELLAADIVVFGVPIYNFSVPATVKAWADLVARAGTTFKYGENGPVGLLEGKKAYIAAASGGTPVGSDMDFMTPWLTFFLGFLGIDDVELVYADGVMGAGGEERIAEAQRLAGEMAMEPA